MSLGFQIFEIGSIASRVLAGVELAYLLSRVSTPGSSSAVNELSALSRPRRSAASSPMSSKKSAVLPAFFRMPTFAIVAAVDRAGDAPRD